MKTLFQILLYIWQLPQNILGLILRVFWKLDNTVLYKDKTIRVCKKFPGNISLGDTVMVCKYPYNKNTWNTVKHEWGHTRQSLYLGPLYLIVIGIPSFLWACTYKWLKKDYSWFYTESWANKLGGIM